MHQKTNVIPEIKDLDDEFNMSNLGPPPAIPRIDEFNAKFNGPFFGPNFEAKTDHPNLLCCYITSESSVESFQNQLQQQHAAFRKPVSFALPLSSW